MNYQLSIQKDRQHFVDVVAQVPISTPYDRARRLNRMIDWLFHTPGYFGTEAPIMVDITLTLEILFFVLLTIGVIAQRRGNYHLHDKIQTPVVVLNTILVIWIMLMEYFGRNLAAATLAKPNSYHIIVTVHALFGITAAVLSIYCLLAGWKILPRRIGQLRKVMILTYAVWAIAVVLGITTYIVWY